MFGTQHLWLFVVSGLLLNITPGQDTLYIVTRSVAQGRAAGVWSVLGISSGSVLHTLAAAFGLSAILATSAEAFVVVKLAGAAYLVYLGAKMLLERPAAATTPGVEAPPARESAWAIYRAALLTNMLNPKVALFFLAFLPQFADPAHFTAQALLLGAVFVVLAILSDGTYAMISGSLGHFLRGQPRFLTAQRWVSGSVYIGLGVLTALADRNTGAAASK
jgi:threonine/homoserine/homoserine lactone efflux protein